MSILSIAHDILADFSHLGKDLIFIQSQEDSILHDQLSVDNGMDDITAAGSVDQMGGNVVHGGEMGLIHVEHNKICLFAYGQ